MWKKILVILGLCLLLISIVMGFFMRNELGKGLQDIFLGVGLLSLNLIEPKRERSRREKISVVILVSAVGLLFIIIGMLNLSPVFRR